MSRQLAVEERIHQLDHVSHPDVKSSGLRAATIADYNLIHRRARDFHAEATPGDPSSGLTRTVGEGLKEQSFYILENTRGEAVTMLKKTRPTKSTISINFVYIHRVNTAETDMPVEL